ncbi:MAG: hypothetical protein V1936_01155 [Patescibacteria group bacterium]
MTDFISAFSRLHALQEILDQQKSEYWCGEEFSDELNSVISTLQEEQPNINLDNFKIREEDKHRQQVGMHSFSSERRAKKDFVLMKVKGCLGYLVSIMSPEDKKKIGFSTEESEYS